MTAFPTPREQSLLVTLTSSATVNAPWLERQALALEQALIEQRGVLGPSVSVNYELNGFEIDVTVEIERDSELDDWGERILAVAERSIGIERVSEPTHAISSEFSASESGTHDTVVPA